MSTIKEEFDYETYTRENAPDPAKIRTYEEREQKWREAAENKTIIPLEKELLEKFEKLGGSRKEALRLISVALREWLVSQDMKKLIREDFQDMLLHVLSSMPQSVATMPISAIKQPLAATN